MGAQQSIQAHPPITEGPDQLWGRTAHSPVLRTKDNPATSSLVYRRRKKRDERRPTIEGYARNGSRRRRASDTDAKKDGAARQASDETPAWLLRRHSAVELSQYAPAQPSDVLRMPGASLLFEAFLDPNVFQLLPGDAGVAAVAPVVLSDDMAMHALLALSASNMAGLVPSVELRAGYHYGRAVKALRDRVTRCIEMKSMETDKPAMLLTVLLLCNFELNYGDPHNASLVHLDGARQMLRNCKKGAGRKYGWTLLSFVLEYFGFMSIAAQVTAVSKEVKGISVDGRTLLPALYSLEELRSRFGFNFGLSYPVLAEIPRVLELTVKEGKSIYEGPLQDESQDTRVKEEDGSDAEECIAQSPPHAFDTSTADRLLRLTILLALYNLAHGPQPPNKALLSTIDPYVDEFYQLIEGVQLNGIITAPLMWSCVLFGSCTQKPDQREALKSMIRESSFKPVFIKTVIKVLEYIWSGEDTHAFGPFGIKRVLALRNMHVEMRSLRAD